MRKTLLLNLGAGILILLAQGAVLAQNITVNTAVTATVLVNSLVDPSVAVSNITQSCKNSQRGTFANGSAVGMSNGIVLTSGNANDAIGPNAEGCGAESANTSVNGNYPISPENDADLKKLDASNPDLYDICKLEFDFTVNADTLSITYVFGSEEYTAYSKNGTEVNDLFGFFISGNEYATPVNFALVPGSTNYVGIKTVNQRACCKTYYTVNCPKASAVANGPQYNGFTNTLTGKIKITPNKTYHVKIAIADAQDDIIDSGVFIKANSIAPVTPLPVNLIYFTAERDNTRRKNKISWKTAQEKNNSFFEILRKTNNTSFEVIAKITGNGNSSIAHTYEYMDELPQNGMNYYMLRQIDFDGNKIASKIVSINNLFNIQTKEIYPNPISEKLVATVEAPEDINAARAEMIDIAGRIIAINIINLTAGNNVISMNTDNLQTGTYFFRVVADNYESMPERIVK